MWGLKEKERIKNTRSSLIYNVSVKRGICLAGMCNEEG